MHRFLSMVVIFLLLIGCSNDAIYKLSSKSSPFQETDFNTSMNVTLSAKYKDDKLAITVTNNSPNEIDFGVFYLLEKQMDGKWKKIVPVNGELAFKSIGYRAPTHGKLTYKVVVGKLKKGTYRAIKTDLSVRGSKDEFIKSGTFDVN